MSPFGIAVGGTAELCVGVKGGGSVAAAPGGRVQEAAG